MNPIVAVGLGWALLGEPLTAGVASSGALIVISVVLALRSPPAVEVEPISGVVQRRA